MKIIKRYSLFFAYLIALISTLASLYYSMILNFKPCIFCWYQRIFMFPLVIILAVAAYKKDISIFDNIIALPIIGAFVAFVQTIFSYFNLSKLVCNEECVQKTYKLFGFLDMSIMSFLAFIAITFLLIIAKNELSSSRN
jgi:disulfide bond formation protein DsbB